MEHDAKDPSTKEGAGVTRGQNVVYVLPHDEAAIAQFLAPALDRLEPGSSETQLLAVTADAESAAWLAGAAARLGGEQTVVAVPATTARRAERLLRGGPAQVVTGTARELLALVKATALKLEGVRVLVLAWADHILEAGDAEALETLLADVPKTAARVIVAGETTGEVEALVERYARRARRVGGEAPAEPAPTSVSYATVSAASRPAALRRLLDELDPASGGVFVRGEGSAHEAGEVLRALGYAGERVAVRLRRAGQPAVEDGVDVVVLYDLPASADELREAAKGARRVVALALPRQLGMLRALAQGGAVSPLTFPDAAARARSRDAALREELRRELERGRATRELLAIEPLLDQWDGAEVAAAALRLLEAAREAIPTASVGAGTSALAKLFVNVGTRDEVRPGDIVGALTNEGGLTGAQVGRVELRDTHTLVEVDAGAAEEAAQRISGKMIKGRRVQARVDRGADRGAERGERPARPPRAGGERRAFERPGADRRGGERGERGDRGERGERGERGGFRERPAGRFDRGEGRGRPARGDERPRRPSPPRPRRGEE